MPGTEASRIDAADSTVSIFARPEGLGLVGHLPRTYVCAMMSTSVPWRKLLLLSVLPFSAIANLDTAQRYLSRSHQGWVLAALCGLSMLLPLLCLLPKPWLHRTWKGLALAAVGIAILSWMRIPIETVRVDRWELMSNFLDRLFHGDYPYLASSKFNVPPPVPFPWLYLVSIPAWLTGELGLFPFLTVALLVWAAPRRNRPLLVWALATSLPVWYEIAVRSNILANAALVGAFLMTQPGRTTSSVLKSAVLGGVVLCTRASFIAPVLIWAGHVFLARRQWKNALVWSATAVFVAVLPFALLIAIWGWPLFLEWNPLRYQGAIQSPWIPLAILFVSPFVGSRVKSVPDRLALSYAAVLVPMLTLLIPVLSDGSWVEINRGYFEVAFWNSALVLGLLAWSVVELERSDER
jgi:hypothetical protein